MAAWRAPNPEFGDSCWVHREKNPSTQNWEINHIRHTSSDLGTEGRTLAQRVTMRWTSSNRASGTWLVSFFRRIAMVALWLNKKSKACKRWNCKHCKNDSRKC